MLPCQGARGAALGALGGVPGRRSLLAWQTSQVTVPAGGVPIGGMKTCWIFAAAGVPGTSC
jgi:hypothetical protein